jgi:hypothetical protein
MPQFPLIDLDATAKPVASVKLCGRTHDVLPMTGNVYMLLHGAAEDAAAAGGATKLDPVTRKEHTRRCYESIAEIVPTLTLPERQRLTMEQVVYLMALSGGDIGAVQALIEDASGNATRPAPRKRGAK